MAVWPAIFTTNTEWLPSCVWRSEVLCGAEPSLDRWTGVHIGGDLGYHDVAIRGSFDNVEPAGPFNLKNIGAEGLHAGGESRLRLAMEVFGGRARSGFELGALNESSRPHRTGYPTVVSCHIRSLATLIISQACGHGSDWRASSLPTSSCMRPEGWASPSFVWMSRMAAVRWSLTQMGLCSEPAQRWR